MVVLQLKPVETYILAHQRPLQHFSICISHEKRNHSELCVTNTFMPGPTMPLKYTVHIHTICKVECYFFLTSSVSSLVPLRWSMRWPAWTSHLWGRVAVSLPSALWDSGPTSQPVCSNYLASQPCTRKCWAEVREKKERLLLACGRDSVKIM